MNRAFEYIFLLTVAVSLAACSRNSASLNDVTPVKIERLDSFVYNYKGEALPDDTLQPGIGIYMQLMDVDTLDLPQAVMSLRDSRYMQVFEPDVERFLAPVDSLEMALGQTVARLNETLPDLKLSNIYGIVSPYRQSVVVSDSVALVALNHYLGSNYEGYGSMPEYMRHVKAIPYLSRDIVQAIVRINYPYSPKDGTLLERMLYEGAVDYLSGVITGDDPWVSLGMCRSDYDLLRQSEKSIWQDLSASGLLYATSPVDIDRLIDSGPFAQIGNAVLPAMPATFIGTKIVSQYVENAQNPDYEFLITPDFYNQSQSRLIESRYSPR